MSLDGLMVVSSFLEKNRIEAFVVILFAYNGIRNQTGDQGAAASVRAAIAIATPIFPPIYGFGPLEATTLSVREYTTQAQILGQGHSAFQ